MNIESNEMNQQPEQTDDSTSPQNVEGDSAEDRQDDLHIEWAGYI